VTGWAQMQAARIAAQGAALSPEAARRAVVSLQTVGGAYDLVALCVAARHGVDL
jgi:hypothetical protein